MDGIFLKASKAILITMIIIDAIIVAIFGIGFWSHPDMDLLIVVIIFLVLFNVIMGVLLLLMNVNPYLHIDFNEKTLSGSFAWGKKLDCPLTDVAFVRAQMNVLQIYLKNGKFYEVPSLMNAPALYTALKRNIFELEKEAPEKVEEDLKNANRSRTKWIVWTILGTVLLMGALALAIFLTDGKDSSELSTAVNIISAVLVAVELGAVILTLIGVNKIAKSKLSILWQEERLRSARIRVLPFSMTQVKQVFSDEYYNGRAIVCGFPNEESAYFTVEKFNGNFELKMVYTSEVYSEINDIPKDTFDGLIDITDRFSAE